jgi:hypothetical protein
VPAAAVAQGGVLPRLVNLAICEGISHDPVSKKFSLYGLFNALTVPALPAPLRPIAFYTRLQGTGRHAVSILVTGPDNVPLGEPVATNVDFGTQPNVEMAGYLGGLPLQRAGIHHVEVLVDGHRVGEPLELEIVLQQAVPNV